MIRVDPADWAPECRRVRPAPAAGTSTLGEPAPAGADIPSVEIDTLLRTISQALALGARNAEGAGYRLLCGGRARVEALDPVEHPWAVMLGLHWRRIQDEYLARHPGADLDR